jgi:PAS domain S-box-containing protein
MAGKIGKILIVDDEVELKNILVEALTSQGYEATGFTSGEAALAALRVEAFDVLLTDLMMPGMDGITLVRESLQIDPHLVCMMMTGQGTIQTAVDAMKEGAFDYVLKPFRLQTVLPVLTRAMNARHMRLENLQLRETVAIYEMAQTIAFTLDPQRVISKLADAALQQTDADEVSILLPVGDGGNELYVAAVRGENRERLLGERVSLDQSISGWVAREREPLILDGEINDQRFRSLCPHPEIRSAISIPMQVAGKLVGTININALSRTRPFTLGQMKALTILSSTAAAALESASLLAQVQKAEENYRSIFEHAVEGIFQATPEGRFLNVNPAMARILGYDSPEELIEKITDVEHQLYVNPEDRILAARIQDEHSIVQGLEFEAYRKDGEKIWLSLNRRSVFDETGTELFREGSVEDVTDRKRAEQMQARREAHALFRADVSAALGTSSAPLRVTLESCAEAMVKHLGAAFGRVWTLNRKENVLELQASAGMYTHIDGAHARVPVGQLNIGKIAEGRMPHITNDLQSDPRVSDQDWARQEQIVAFAGFPLLVDDRLLGVMAMFSRETLAEDTLDALSSVAEIISQGVDRKRAEQELSKSEERYRDLVENAQDIIYSHDLRGNYTSSNKAGEEITGYTQEESLKLNLAQTIAPHCVERAREMVARKLRGEKVTAYELELIAKDGHYVTVEVNTRLMLQDGAPIGITGIARDITERKLAEAELRRLAAAVEETADSVVITDKEGNIQYVNPAFERVTGYAREEVLNQNPRILKSGKTPAAIFKAMWETIARGEVWTGQLINRKKDGTLFDERVTISAINDESGRIVNYVAVKQDISSLIQLEEQLRQSQKMEAIGQLAGGVAHDFNNLLTAINGYSSLALQRVEANHPLRSYLEEIKKAGDRAANLTRQLLAFGRKQILQPLPIDLNDVVMDMNKMLRRLIGEDIQLTAKLHPQLKKIKADPGQIEQVLVNLVVNARDAMPQGGTLTIETTMVELDQEYGGRHLGASPGHYTMLAVSDTGTGMDEQTQARIFDPFFTTKEKGKGTGLGLSTVYGIVKQSGGNILVYSEPGHGTTFKVYLPQLTTEVQPAPAVVPEAAIQGGTETILLVEDEDVVRGLAQKILEQSGYKVIAAARGEEAIRFGEEHSEPINLLLTDVVMPVTSGKEVADRLRPLLPGLRVIFMSGYTDEAIVHHGVLDSDIEFIQKPFTPNALIKKVREVLDAETVGKN